MNYQKGDMVVVCVPQRIGQSYGSALREHRAKLRVEANARIDPASGMKAKFSKAQPDPFGLCVLYDVVPNDANPANFTPELETICAYRCAVTGDPPCWRLPDLVDPCEQITPCKDCVAQRDY